MSFINSLHKVFGIELKYRGRASESLSLQNSKFIPSFTSLPTLILLSSAPGEGYYSYLTVKPMSILKRESLNKISNFIEFIKPLKLLDMYYIIKFLNVSFH